MIQTVEGFNEFIVITNTDGTRDLVPKLNANINVPTSGTAVYLQTIGVSYTIDYTTIEYPVASSRDELAEIINSYI